MGLPKLAFYTLTVSCIPLMYINNMKEFSYSFIDKVNTYINWTKENECNTYWNNLSVYSNEIKNQVLTNTKEKYKLEFLGRILSISEQPICASSKSVSNPCPYDNVSISESDNASDILPNDSIYYCFRNIINIIYKKKKHKKTVFHDPKPISVMLAPKIPKNKKEPSPDLQPYSINYTIRKFPRTGKIKGYCMKGKKFMILACEPIPTVLKVDSRNYISYFLTLFKQIVNSSNQIKSKDSIEYAYKNNYYNGAISICAIVINADNTLSASLIGNQQYVIIRDKKIIHKGKYTNGEYSYLGTVGLASYVMNEEVPIEKGDIIISGSSVIWNALQDDQILVITSSVDFSMLSKAIARSAYIYTISELETVRSNYDFLSWVNTNFYSINDDISVACARIN
ncbi:protein phosphatase, putative [Plasmodium berghei]|uniref:Protein phosphatase, putative n=1 Tax=Plasmodium berghei TaxID=5821 RepID=A0A0Y9YC92_PLABE|nr:protein phosphatase, putative [Plasmodium berghei]